MSNHKPKFIVLGGINGAGKSTMREHLFNKNLKTVIIDPDKLSKAFQAQGMDKAKADIQGGKQAIHFFYKRLLIRKILS